MAYKVIILYQLYMPSYFLGTFTEYPCVAVSKKACSLSENIRFGREQDFLFLLY